MSSWILFALIAIFLWALANIVDKYIFGKYNVDPLFFLIFSSSIGLIFAIIILTKNFAPPTPNILLFSFLAGLSYIICLFGYFNAIKMEEASRTIALFQLVPLFALFFSVLLLKEDLALRNYLGIFLLVIGAFLISIKKDFKLRNKKVFLIIFVSSAFFALVNIFTKYLLQFTDYWTSFAYIRILVFLLLIPVFFLNFPRIKSAIGKIEEKKTFGFMVLSGVSFMFGLIFFTKAISVGFVSLVTGMSSFQPLFVLILALILSVFSNVFKEEIDGSTIALKFLAVLLISAGVFLIV